MKTMNRYLRCLRNAFSCTCSIAAVLFVLLWVRSYHTADRLHGRIWNQQSFLLGSKEGAIVAIVFRSHGAPGWWQWETRSYPVDDELSFPFGSVEQYESHLGFGWLTNPIYMVMRSTQTLPGGQQIMVFGAATATLNGAGPVVPIWYLTVVSCALAALPWIRWPRNFSLRTLLIATALIAAILGFAAATKQ